MSTTSFRLQQNIVTVLYWSIPTLPRFVNHNMLLSTMSNTPTSSSWSNMRLCPYANINILVCQKSDYFAAMFRSNMRESIERVVVVPDCSKASFLRVLEYLCLDVFSGSIDHAVELWQLADMYQLEGLKYVCMGVLERGLCEENVSQILQDIEDLSCPCEGLKSMCHVYHWITRVGR